MNDHTIEVLQTLQAGMEAQFYPDMMVVQITKTSLTVFAIVCFLWGVFQFFRQMTKVLQGQKQSLSGYLGAVVMLGSAFLLYDKADGYQVLDDKTPFIVITPAALAYDAHRSGWSIGWRQMETVELAPVPATEPQEATHEIRVHIREGYPVEWKYPPAPDNDMAAVKSAFDKTRFLVVDPKPLGISPEMLQKALEKYRAGS